MVKRLTVDIIESLIKIQTLAQHCHHPLGNVFFSRSDCRSYFLPYREKCTLHHTAQCVVIILSISFFPLPLSIVSPVLESLRCYNDYSSYVRCSWEESPHASSQAPLALYYWDDTENR